MDENIEDDVSLNTPLQIMQKMLEENYTLYRSGTISEYEYLVRIKPIDKEIGKLEMSTLLDNLVLKGSSSGHIPKPGN